MIDSFCQNNLHENDLEQGFLQARNVEIPTGRESSGVRVLFTELGTIYDF